MGKNRERLQNLGIFLVLNSLLFGIYTNGLALFGWQTVVSLVLWLLGIIIFMIGYFKKP